MSECIETEDCGICGLSIDDKFSYTLACNHTFHYECLMKSFQNTPKYKKNIAYLHSDERLMPDRKNVW